MADIALKRTHQLGLKSARVAADKMADKLGEKFELSGTWSGDTLNFSRPGVSGFLKISETEMHLEVSLGFMLKLMKAPIEKSVHEQLDKVLKDAAIPKAAAKVVAPKAAPKAAPKTAAKVAAKPAAPKPAAKKPAKK